MCESTFPPAADPLASVARGDERFRETPSLAESVDRIAESVEGMIVLERIADLLDDGTIILDRIATALERIDRREADLR